MSAVGTFGLQTLVSASFTAIYLVQPVLPVIRQEFGMDEKQASYTVSAVIVGIALANLPFGRLADRFPVKPLIAVGGIVLTLFGLLCAVTHQMALLIVFRFVQGLFIPTMTTCLVAYLARSLPVERFNVVMGSYVAATVAGGLGGRLLGGWIHPPLDWRWAFVTASLLSAAATLAALLWLPREAREAGAEARGDGFLALIARPDLLRIFAVAFSAFWIFSVLFNYLPSLLPGRVGRDHRQRLRLPGLRLGRRHRHRPAAADQHPGNRAAGDETEKPSARVLRQRTVPWPIHRPCCQCHHCRVAFKQNFALWTAHRIGELEK
ncbi:MAG: MFS transporter [Desulfobacteraceae bacterium]|nr:MFS transporter [Desulfobacteraceae bacterium]